MCDHIVYTSIRSQTSSTDSPMGITGIRPRPTYLALGYSGRIAFPEYWIDPLELASTGGTAQSSCSDSTLHCAMLRYGSIAVDDSPGWRPM